MKNIAQHYLRSVLVSLTACLAMAASASVPFVTTQLDGDAFSDTTTWYTMTIGSSGLLISNPGSADRIYLNSGLKDVGDNNLWCFVGNDEDGYTIYNKAAGTGVVLSSPSTLSGETGVHGTRNGGDGYVVLKAPGTSGYVNLWQFASSSDLGGDNDVYMYQKGQTANKVNNRNGVLAFWTVGQDAGSTITISFGKKRIPVNLQTGTFTSSNSAKTYHSTWTYSQSNPLLTLSHPKNNISLPNSENNAIWRMATNNGNTYTFGTSSGYIVSAVGFDFNNSNTDVDMTVSVGSVSASAHESSTATFSVDGLTEQTAQINLTPTGSNAIDATNIWAVVERSFAEAEASVELFQTFSGGIPYRIPAIAVAQNGDVIAVSDYRYCRADIGNGRIDLYARISHDNGKTWDPTVILAQGDGVMDSRGRNYSLTAGYGDACIVADRESPKVLMMSVCGYQTFPNGSREVPNQVARWYSNDNGQTWSDPEVITETFYVPFDENCVRGPIRSMFVGSGKIHQSRYIKVGDYYRLYCSSLTKDVNGTNCNYVWYSDDFGETWTVLGDVNEPAIPSGADEPKTEELPDGSVIVSSRCGGGRLFNIFSYTDMEKAEGSWGSSTSSGSGNNGVVAAGNSCNGEIIILPAKRKSDGAQVYLALQSVPFGNGRSNVGIYYKELASFADDFADPATFSKDWDGRHQSSTLGSAYSTYALQQDGTLGFLYEEETYGAGYTIVYKNYSLEQITDSAYSYTPADEMDNDAISQMLKTEMELKVSGLEAGTAVGQVDAEAVAAIQAQAQTAEGTVENVAAIQKLISEGSGIPLEAGRWYRLRNALYPTYYLTPSTSDESYYAGTYAATNFTQLFTFEPDGDNWRIKCGNLESYIGKTQAREVAIPQATLETSGLYEVIPHVNGQTQIRCLNAESGSYESPHFNSSKSFVSWTVGATASQWIIEPVEEVQTSIPSGGYASRMFSFDVSVPEGYSTYAVTGIQETESDTAYAILTEIAQPVPAHTPFVIAGSRGSVKLNIAEPATYSTVEGNMLSGILASTVVNDATMYGFRSTKPVGYILRTALTSAVSANTALLHYTGTSKFIKIDPEYITGIGVLTLDGKDANVWYDLQGRRVAQPKGGVYVNGKGAKVIFK